MGNLYASGLIQLRNDDPPAPTLALLAGIALYRSVGSTDVYLKWPNDLMIGDAKVAGVLLEREDDNVVIGVGVNLIVAPEIAGRATTTLAAHGLNVLIEILSNQVKRYLLTWRSKGVAAICEAWSRGAHRIGTALAANFPDGKAVEGLYDGLTDDGALRLRLADGTHRVIHAGDVFLI